ncbi:endo-1,4-beta-xylanase [Actinomadura sp. NBRC 104412]|uniref:endo-1,4-beta-xylanase n=1 Tax=Actinomadura sp. NBRC 104412 TaxID=3032203 RepID=UPI0025534389|nr:endo-1,4-beta-xylanase [Actinomadura sp. NBRC 104412]
MLGARVTSGITKERTGDVAMLRNVIGVIATVAALAAFTAIAAPDPGGGASAGAAHTARAAGAASRSSGGWSADPPVPVGKVGFGVDIVGVGDGSMPTIDVGAVRLWDDATRWSTIEPQQDVYNWSTLDALVDGARSKGLPVLYTMGQTPLWANPQGDPCKYSEPCTIEPPEDLSDWDDYVHRVVTRYKGRIEAYELWNEATHPGYYGGTVEQMRDMARRAYQIIKSVDPSALVVSPSATMLHRTEVRDWMRRFAELGGYTYADRVAVHLYTDGTDHAIVWPERAEDMVATARSVLAGRGVTKPIWDTETTEEPEADPFPGTDRQAADWVTRYFLMGLYNRLGRSYYYGWGEDGLGLKLQDAGREPTIAGHAVTQLVGWMKGASIRYCGHGTAYGLPPDMWQCGFAYQTGEYAVIRWTGQGSVSYPTGPTTYEAERIGASPQPVQPGQSVQVTGTPVIIRYR